MDNRNRYQVWKENTHGKGDTGLFIASLAILLCAIIFQTILCAA